MEFVERLLSEAAARGDFDAGPGAARSIGTGDDGPGWWVRRELDRIRSDDARHAVIADAERELGSVWSLPNEAMVRDRVEELNRRLDQAGARDASLDAEETVRTWRRMARLRSGRLP